MVLLATWVAACDPVHDADLGERTTEARRYPLQLTAPVSAYRVVSSYPHDRQAFTQGLVIDDGVLFESTGRRGSSWLRRVVLETGNVEQQADLDNTFFGEGIAVVDDRIIQLTWQNRTGFVYDRTSFERIDTFDYDHEGWGVTYDGEQLIVSDGTATLRFWDPETLDEIRSIIVKDGELGVRYLNELEYIDGEVWANVYRSDFIARIDPATGHIIGWIDLRGLLPDAERPSDQGAVLNGIAYDAVTGRIFVTGKLWPRLFEIKLAEPLERAPTNRDPL